MKSAFGHCLYCKHDCAEENCLLIEGANHVYVLCNCARWWVLSRMERTPLSIQAVASLGGYARAKKLTQKQRSKIGMRAWRAGLAKLSKERRTEITRHAAQVRWERYRLLKRTEEK